MKRWMRKAFAMALVLVMLPVWMMYMEYGGKNYRVRVVTSDNLIRLSALRSGVLRESSKEFALEVEGVLQQIEALLKKSNESAHKVRLRDGRA